ncbi:MAG: peptidylprolyl isomerase [Thermodesulfobacteriota bacterium]
MTVAAGKEISIEYTLKLEDESVIDSNVGGDPLTFVHGAQQIIPGLEDALLGLKVGDNKEVTVTPKDGYGIVSKEAFAEVPREQIPEDGLKVDAQLEGTNTDGQPIVGRVAEINEKTVLIDFNHPLAGKTLHFDVKILNVQAEAANEPANS